MKRLLIISLIAVILLANTSNVAVGQRSGSSAYYPPAGDNWQRRQPAEAGFDPALLEQAVAFAKTQETKVPRDFSTQVATFGALLGPVPKEGGRTEGIIIRKGLIVA